jgi:hypothetical protein
MDIRAEFENQHASPHSSLNSIEQFNLGILKRRLPAGLRLINLVLMSLLFEDP